MTTLQDLVHRTRRHFYTEARDEIDRLTTDINTSVTSITVEFARSGIKTGAILGVGLEEMLVMGVSGASVTVQRGFNGTTAAAALDGDLIRINPKISDAGIVGAINDDLVDLSSPDNGLFTIATVAITYNAGTDTYDLTGVTDLIRVLDVTFDANDGTDRWPHVDHWTLTRGLATADFPSSMALTVNSYAESGRPVRVTYAKPFTALTSLAQNVETHGGLPATAHDIPPMGAAMRLADGGELARNFLTQGDTRRADEVPPQARGVAMRPLQARRRERIAAEASRLYARWPARSPV